MPPHAPRGVSRTEAIRFHSASKFLPISRAAVAFTQLASQMLALRRATLAGALGTGRQRWGLGAALALGGVGVFHY
eukprot:COSAG04_NODE_582_length_12404_cov_81.591792_14_plen_76_part_00